MCLASVPIVCSQSLLRDLSCQQRGQGKQGNHPADDQSARVVWARQGPECSGEDRIYRCFLWVTLGHVRLFETPWTVARQAPLWMGFSRQEYWSGLPFPSPDPGTSATLPPQNTHTHTHTQESKSMYEHRFILLSFIQPVIT